jgi:hypothetical protein
VTINDTRRQQGRKSLRVAVQTGFEPAIIRKASTPHVAASALGKGIGKELLRQPEQVLIESGCATLIFDVWKDDIGFAWLDPVWRGALAP